MPRYETKRNVAHTAQQMFDLVADVESYPQFLPLCEQLTIRTRKERDGNCLLVADMTVGYKALHETFTTQVYIQPEILAIDVQYIDGPFSFLNNRWHFEAMEGEHCCVDFFIEYAFKSKMLGAVMGTVFERAFKMFAEAFEKRADQLYRA